MKLQIILASFMVVFILDVRCQTCFTEITTSNIKAIEATIAANGNRSYDSINPIVRLALHRVIAADSTGGITWQEINDWMNVLVSDFIPFNICFTVVSKDEIADAYFYPMSTLGVGADTLRYHRNVPNAVDVFFIELVGAGGGSASGGLLSINRPPTVMVSKNAGGIEQRPQLNTGVLSHEMGHVLGLYHTHETSAHGTENIPRTGPDSNCLTAGDLLCGTPADPNLNLSYDMVGDATNCNYVGGNGYSPDTRNIMSYTLEACMNTFTADQGARMLSVLRTTSFLDSVVIPWSDTVKASLPKSPSQLNYYYSTQNELIAANGESDSFTISASCSATLEAVAKVVLKPGFKAKYGSVVNVRLGEFPCDSPFVFNSAKTDMDIPSSISDVNRAVYENQISVTPNPTTYNCNLSFSFVEDRYLKISLLNLLGGEVTLAESFVANAGNSAFKFTTSNYAAGVYFLRINDGVNTVTKKLVIQH